MSASSDSGSIKNWQIAFIFGLIALVVSAFFVLSSPLFTSLIGLAGVLIVLLNSLLGAPKSDKQQDSWLLALVKRSLTVGPFLRAATICVWLITLSLGIFGTVSAYHERHKINLTLHLLTNRGDPISDAIVRIKLMDSLPVEQESVTSGNYKFPKFDLGKRDDAARLPILVTWKNLQKQYFVDVSKPLREVPIFHMPPSEPPINIYYFILSNQGVDLLLDHTLDPRWGEIKLSDSEIIQNSVYDQLSYLVSHYRDLTLQGDQITAFVDREKHVPNIQLARQYAHKPLFRGSYRGVLRNDSAQMQDFSKESGAVLSAYAVASTQQEENQKRNRDTLANFALWRFADENDLATFQRTRLKGDDQLLLTFYADVTRERFPQKFFFMWRALMTVKDPDVAVTTMTVETGWHKS